VTSSGERGLRNGLRLRETGKTFVAYHDLLSDWKKVVNRIDREQHINWPYSSAAFNLEIDNFLGKMAALFGYTYEYSVLPYIR
jgi:hypothetical protein